MNIVEKFQGLSTSKKAMIAISAFTTIGAIPQGFNGIFNGLISGPVLVGMYLVVRHLVRGHKANSAPAVSGVKGKMVYCANCEKWVEPRKQVFRRGSAAAGAIIGGELFGVLGSVVGASAGSNSKSENHCPHCNVRMNFAYKAKLRRAIKEGRVVVKEYKGI